MQESQEIDLSVLQRKDTNTPKKTKKEEKKDEAEQVKAEKDLTKLINKPQKQKKELPSEDETIKKRHLIIKIQFALINFPDDLKAFKKIPFEKKSHDELKSILQEVHFTLNNSISVDSGVELLKKSILTLEYITCAFTPVNCSGLSNALCNDPAVIKDMKHICVKNMGMVTTEPEARLLFRVLTSMLTLHSLNGNNFNNDQLVEQSNQIDTINNKFKDL